MLKQLLKSVLPQPVLTAIRKVAPADPTSPPVGFVDWGGLRRTTPISRNLFARGQPVDRRYIDEFLTLHQADIHGRVLEVKDSAYTKRFGGARVAKAEVLDVDADNPHATICADLNNAGNLPTDAFDCILLTHVLQLVANVRGAVKDLHRSLKPGGVMLVASPGVTPVLDRPGLEEWYWTFTPRSLRETFAEYFPAENLQVETHGNVLAATAMLHGVSASELSREELAVNDPAFAVIVSLRAVK